MGYDNIGRAAAADATRRRILDAAHASFIARGFAGTTIRLVADEAGVSQETIFKAYGGKAGLLKAVYDVTLAGDDEEVPLAQRPEAVRVRAATTPPQAAARYAALARVVSARTDPLLRVLLRARDTDKTLSAFGQTIDEERRRGALAVVRHWSASGWLREDLDVERAADVLWALNSAEPRWLLQDRGWSADQLENWLAEMVAYALFGEDSAASGRTSP